MVCVPTSKPTTPDDCRVFDAWQMERMETGTLPDMPEIMSGMWMAMAALWIAGLAALVLAEKLLPAGERIAKLTCLPLIGAGIWLLVGS